MLFLGFFPGVYAAPPGCHLVALANSSNPWVFLVPYSLWGHLITIRDGVAFKGCLDGALGIPVLDSLSSAPEPWILLDPSFFFTKSSSVAFPKALSTTVPVGLFLGILTHPPVAISAPYWTHPPPGVCHSPFFPESILAPCLAVQLSETALTTPWVSLSLLV